MTGLKWIRLDVSFASDPLIQALSFADQRHFVILLCWQGAGHLDKRVPPKLRNEMVARGLGIPIDEAEALHQRLKKLNLVTQGWQIADWERMQFPSDSSAARTRKWRKNKKSGDAAVTSPVTSPKRHGDGLHTDIHTDITKQTKAQTRAPTHEGPPPGSVQGLDTTAWDIWFAYRKDIKKPIKPASVEAAQTALAKYGSHQAAVVEQSIANGWQGLFDLKSPDTKGNGKLIDRRSYSGSHADARPGESWDDYDRRKQAEKR